ncbi:MAG: N-(5'-phosphoribosyl)anthranilate isomerase [Firmicutes bacterium HGW-Firmicutes-9]|jgi:phosphoribosylanthranilate isomerase|nr:MAG: N-(5'-phosphoribosyl)anthranilate isomerase [Firmicutes bacterium HGW-Firmicutes-9]
MTRVKVCGLKRPEDMTYANELLPDYVGFVFAKASKRYVSPESAAALREQLSPQIVTVGVFVDESVESVVSLLQSGMIGMAQLHGAETAEYIRALRSRSQAPIIQAFRIATRDDVLRAEQSQADYILLDHGAGGTGESFDWSLLDGIERPFFLAGGLSAENVGEAIARYKPFAVDSSSKLETDGLKDYNKMKAFVEAVRQNG